jgi:hypothetical protein
MPVDYDYTGIREQERHNYTVGELLDAINDRMIAKTEDLMKATEIGRGLLAEAICTADDQDNAEFFAAAIQLLRSADRHRAGGVRPRCHPRHDHRPLAASR